ncbi:MAG: transposase [Candidatus Omnitrophica bacterium]|nr:transposase [Candidatus Omnitrophota bacterium]
MPNNIHGIVVLTGRAGLEPAPTGKYGLSEIVRQFKTFSSKRVNKVRNTQGGPMWQRNYYEHVIRNDNELNLIREYINNNPVNWKTDEAFKE